MKTYTLTCGEGHEPMTWTVEANSPTEAAGLFMGMDELKAHVGEKHAEMLNLPDDQKLAALVKMITPTE